MFKTLYVLVFIRHGRRELVQCERDRQPDGCLGLAPTPRGDAVG
jgi:hypothetical protein